MIIAEFCGNHLGNQEILHKMVEEAAKAGAKFVKIQTFFADDLSPEWQHDYSRLKDLELDWDAHAKFADKCKQHGIIPMTSIYDAKYLPEIQKAGIQWIKIGSPQVTDYELIKTCVATGFKTIISTGGHDLKKIERFGPLAGVLHCVSDYPANPFRANLIRMLEIKNLWPNTPYGISSHFDPIGRFDWREPLYLASYLGATFIEVHFTVLPRDKTKDGKVSLDPEQLYDICKFDSLSNEAKLGIYDSYGVFKAPQSQSEIDLIEKYKTRWRK